MEAGQSYLIGISNHVQWTVSHIQIIMDSEQILQEVLRVLNEAATADRHAITLLVEHHVPASPELIEHPTIQVSKDGSVGALGLINGIVERLTGKRVMAVIEDDDGVEWVTHFKEYKPSDK